MKKENIKLTNFIIFSDCKHREIVKEIYVEGDAYSSMSLDHRQKTRDSYKVHKDNSIGVNVLSKNCFIRKQKVA